MFPYEKQTGALGYGRDGPTDAPQISKRGDMFHFEKFAVISDTHYDSPSFPEEEKNRLTKEFFKNIRSET